MLLVTFDTTRADHLGCYGYPLARTPALDALAAEGMRAERHSTVAPITLVAHASMMTGLYPPAHGVRDNGTYRVPDEVTTLAEIVRDNGYCTAAFVSALVLDRRYNLGQGFEHYDDDLWGEDAAPLFMIRDRPAPRTAARALAWLDGWSNADKRPPFFLWVHFFDPHQPYEARGGRALLSPTPYDSEIAVADGGFEAIVSRLRELSVLDDTVVIASADHGESLGAHGEKTHAIFTYETTLHTPFILRYPKRVASGTRYAEPSSAADVTPTVLDLLGLEGRGPLQGRSLLAAPIKRAVYAESYAPAVGFGMAALEVLRDGDWKYIRAPRPELYDLRVDPREENNLAASHPDVTQRMHEALATLIAESVARAPRAPADVPLSQRDYETLMALGYVAQPTAVSVLKAQSPTPIDPKDGLPIYRAVEDARHAGQRGDWAAAEKILVDISHQHPENTQALAILGLAQLRQGKLDAAQTSYARVLAVSPSSYRAAAMLGHVALERGDVARAEKHFQTAAGMAPDFLEATLWAGYTALLRGDAVAADAWFSKGEARDPSFFQLYRRVGDASFRRHEWLRALDFYERLLTHVPLHFPALVQAGLAAAHANDFVKATTNLTMARDLRPDSWLPVFNLGWVEAQQGHDQQALALVREAVHLGFNRPELLESDDDWRGLRSLPDYEPVRLSAHANKTKR